MTLDGYRIVKWAFGAISALRRNRSGLLRTQPAAPSSPFGSLPHIAGALRDPLGLFIVGLLLAPFFLA